MTTQDKDDLALPGENGGPSGDSSGATAVDSATNQDEPASSHANNEHMRTLSQRLVDARPSDSVSSTSPRPQRRPEKCSATFRMPVPMSRASSSVSVLRDMTTPRPGSSRSITGRLIDL